MPKKTYTLVTIFILLLIPVFTVQAQYYSSGADPASIKWEQIDTDRFKMVFPSEFSQAATELAHYLDSVAPMIEATLEHTPRKIDILIHGRSAYSNGFVSWAPRRIELYPNPSQDNYSTDWLKHLALHEYRHVVQIDKLRRGFTRFASWLTGEQATGAVLGAYLPMWFIEGDAVITETTLSKSGRGRLPVFTQPLRARLAKYGFDGFDKAYLGSFKEFVPDYYKMGYHLTAEVRRRYGSEIWSDVIDNVGRNSWSLIPFRKELRQTGFRNPKRLYNDVFDSLAISWQKYDDAINESQHKVIAQGTDDYTNLEYPEITSDGSIFAQISGPGQRTRIVEITSDQNPQTIAYTGSRENEPITANDRWVAWTEAKPHIRWPNAEYSVVRLFDRQTRKTSTLTSESRYFSPSLSQNSNTLAAVETTDEYEFYITLLNTETGNVLKRISTPQNAFPIHPAWTDKKNELVVVLLNDSGKNIVTLDTKSNDWKTIRTARYDEPKYPEKYGDNLWFTASTKHAEEIFRTHLPSGKTDRVTTSRFGASSPALNPAGDILAYADYTPEGYQLVSADAFQTEEEDVSAISLTNQLVEDLTQQEPSISATGKSSISEVKPYSKWNLINLHSWAPAYVDIDDAGIYPGVTLMSQNLLGTAAARIGYNAASAESREKFNVGFTYRGWFPIIDFDVKWGDFKEEFNNVYINNDDIFTLEQTGKTDHVKVETGIRIPLDISSGKWNRLLQPRTRLSWQNVSNRNYEQTFLTQNNNNELVETGETNHFTEEDLDYWGMDYSLYFHNKLRGTSRDVGTRWGQTASVIYRHTPWGNYDSGQAFAISSRFHLPGIGKHHAISVDNSWQIKLPGDETNSTQRFGDLLSFPRGYNQIDNDEMYVFRGTYHMPLWNPDVSLGGLAYIKRFRLNLFFDAAHSTYELEFPETREKVNSSATFSSSGIELLTDFHVLRFVLPFSMGYRGGFRDMDKSFFHEVIFATSFNSFLINNEQ